MDDSEMIRRESDSSSIDYPLALRSSLDYAVIGGHQEFAGPFGKRKYVYMDSTASGRSLSVVENFISNHVLPNYANTHTTTSRTSLQTTLFRDQARDIIRKVVGATDEDEVIFCGSGATAAVHKLVHHCLGPRTKPRKLIVFVGSYEHHSNILPWREAASKVIQVPLDIYGNLDLDFLHAKLKVESEKRSKKEKLIVGCFSAGSNISGALTDDILITSIMHQYGGFAFWDYAAAAPHVQIRMNPGCGGFGAKKDAIFFSGHKFLGGPQTPGVLVVKKHVLLNPVPHGAGGGTVLFTTRKNHQYLESIHEREEGGTPDIIGSIRLGLVVRVRNSVGINLITEVEAGYCWKALQHWNTVPEIHILGSSQSPRLPIVSFMIEHVDSVSNPCKLIKLVCREIVVWNLSISCPNLTFGNLIIFQGYFLHHNYVVALLNDLFGIQCRGGCMCAGPYAQHLLGLDDSLASAYESALKKSLNDKWDHITKIGTLLKPGFVRVAFSYHSSPEEIDFVIKAVAMIAKIGWKLLPMYHMAPDTSVFTFNGRKVCMLLNVLQLGKSHSPDMGSSFPSGTGPIDYPMVLKEAHSIFQKVPKLFHVNQPVQDEFDELLNVPEAKTLKWLLTPLDSLILQTTTKSGAYIKSSKAFSPRKPYYANSLNLLAHKGSIPRMIMKAWLNDDLQEIPPEHTISDYYPTCNLVSDKDTASNSMTRQRV
ncbi:putative cysteine desulfurase [Orchesella cincta]|uniref:Putative cysteine desulfurase n=1 Tax=Orchesella cincta TaxID=48709 RepID=A0A1D2MEK4_ORCCI|nr:putative cysteine desulfurase [Orchesella cincta]